MEWKSQYIANLLAMAASDEAINNREFLALLQIEKRIHSKIENYIDAMEHADAIQYGNDTPDTFSLLVNHRHLEDLFALAMVDGALVELETRLIDRFIAAAGIPKHTVDNIRARAKAKAERLIQDAIDNDPAS